MTTPAQGTGLPSDKLIKPLNAPRAAPLAPGVQPGASSGVTLAQYVVVFGDSGGIFVYAGTPGLGNPPVYWFGNVTSDPYGNALDQGIWAGQPGTNQVGIQTDGTFARVFFATPGDQVRDASIGIVIQGSGQAVLELLSGQATANPDTKSDAVGFFLWDDNGGTTAQLQGGYYDIHGGFNQFFTGGWGGFYLSAVAEFNAVDPTTGTDITNPFQPENWHSITTDANWSGISGYGPLQYRLIPGGSIQLSGGAQFTGSPGNPQALNSGNPVPASYRPGQNRYYRSGDAHRMGVQLGSNGVIECFPVSGGVNQIDIEGTCKLLSESVR